MIPSATTLNIYEAVRGHELCKAAIVENRLCVHDESSTLSPRCKANGLPMPAFFDDKLVNENVCQPKMDAPMLCQLLRSQC